MKILIFIFFCSLSYSNCEDEYNNLEKAKMMFKESQKIDPSSQDSLLNEVKSLLENVLIQDDENPEARYFLGYTLGKINSKDGNGIVKMDYNLVLEASKQFEMVNRLALNYTGELYYLDPYSKITGEWGSLALKYLYENKGDSAVFAFKESKKRGGFSDFILAFHRHLLDVSSPNSILITIGDNNIFPLLYLQEVDNFRTDVKIVDIGLLNTTWYPHYLIKKDVVQFDINEKEIDSTTYAKWSDTTITIGDFQWVVKPSYNDEYLLRDELLLLSLLKKSGFQNGLFFFNWVDKNTRLSLNDYFFQFPFLDQLMINETITTENRYRKFKVLSNALYKSSKKVNENSLDERRLVNGLLYECLEFITKMFDEIGEDDAVKSSEVYESLEILEGSYLEYNMDNKTKSDEVLEYIRYLKSKIKIKKS